MADYQEDNATHHFPSRRLCDEEREPSVPVGSKRTLQKKEFASNQGGKAALPGHGEAQQNQEG